MSYETIAQELKQKSVTLVAVSKLQPIEKIRDLYRLGQRHFAENYMQEAIQKKLELKDLPDIVWHFIGHLQKNKVKNVVGQFAYIHSVDSLELVKKINQAAAAKSLTQNIFIELNLAGEASKTGVSETELQSLLTATGKMQNVSVVGLMTMPPLSTEPEKSRPFFKTLKNLSNKFALSQLSMGTSGDYRVAIEEGATMVRLGTILFGERPRNQ